MTKLTPAEIAEQIVELKKNLFYLVEEYPLKQDHYRKDSVEVQLEFLISALDVVRSDAKYLLKELRENEEK